MEKGTHGYIDRKRNRLIMCAVLNVVLVIFLFVIGLILTKTKSNYYTVMAVLMTIPLAYFVTGLAAIGPFRSLDEEKWHEFHALTGKAEVNAVTATDLILTIKEKQMYAGAVLFTSAEVALYTENVKKLYEFHENLSGVLKNTGYFSNVYLTDDWNEFVNRVKADLEAEMVSAANDTSAYAATRSELEKQKERLLIYSV